jgi:hypothetical protein
MVETVAALGYGFHLPESRFMLDRALEDRDRDAVREACLNGGWPQPSMPNKIRMWTHLSNRYLIVDAGKIVETPFLSMYHKLKSHEAAQLDLMFYQLCRTTPVLLETLRSLAAGTLFNTGQASFTKYHLDQLLESLFGRITKSTCERIRQILVHAGRFILEGRTYIAKTSCPAEAVLGYALYADAERNGWRAPSSQTVTDQGDLSAIFLCSRPLLVAGIHRLSGQGYCELHRHGQTDQIQLMYRDLRSFVDAWRE